MRSTISSKLGADRRKTPRAGKERRKTIRLFRHWQKQKGAREQPVWTPGFLGKLADLADFCLAGRGNSACRDRSLHHLGENFLDQLDIDGPIDPVKMYSAAVMMGEITRIGGNIGKKGKQLFVSGEFQDLDRDLVKCRSIVLSFQPEPDDPHIPWIGLASWSRASAIESGASRSEPHAAA